MISKIRIALGLYTECCGPPGAATHRPDDSSVSTKPSIYSDLVQSNLVFLLNEPLILRAQLSGCALLHEFLTVSS